MIHPTLTNQLVRYDSNIDCSDERGPDSQGPRESISENRDTVDFTGLLRSAQRPRRPLDVLVPIHALPPGGSVIAAVCMTQ